MAGPMLLALPATFIWDDRQFRFFKSTIRGDPSRAAGMASPFSKGISESFSLKKGSIPLLASSFDGEMNLRSWLLQGPR